MVKKVWIIVSCLVLILAVAKASIAQPIVLQQAENTIAADKVELGLGFIYGSEKFTIAGQTGDFTRSDFSIPILFKWAVTNSLETKLVLPYTTWKNTGTGLADASNGGFGQMVLGGKLNIVDDDEAGLSIGANLDLELPTGSATKGLGEGSHILVRGGIMPSSGFNLPVSGILTQKFEPLIFHVNLGYKLTGEYTVEGVKINTGDTIIYGVAGEYVAGGGLSLIGELVGTSFGKAKIDDTEVNESNGITFDGVLGMSYTTEGSRITLGIPIALGDATYRAYDFKIVSAYSLIF